MPSAEKKVRVAKKHLFILWFNFCRHVRSLKARIMERTDTSGVVAEFLNLNNEWLHFAGATFWRAQFYAQA